MQDGQRSTVVVLPADTAIGWVSVVVAAAASVWLTLLAWQGKLGLLAMLLVGVAAFGFLFGRRRLTLDARRSVDLIGKTVFTIVGGVALLRHPIPVGDGRQIAVFSAIADYIDQVDVRVFVLFALIAMLVKFVGVITSAYSWYLLLVGQGIRFPFWSKIMTSFLIGRFIGTFLPGTLGLDGYTLYDASHYSNQWQRAVTAKALEKIIGSAGLFLGMVLTLPFGYAVIQDVTAQVGRPHAAPLLAAVIVLVAGGVSAVVTLGLVWPVLLTRTVQLFGQLMPERVGGQVDQFTKAVGAYRGQVGLLLLALLSKFVTHFTTAAVYYFTALAIGVVGAHFWPIVFGSTIQIVATVFSPTIAGEGAREAFQALLLSKHLGGVAQAVLSAALGFWAAEAATLWGGAFIWVRKPGWRPAFALVDGQQVDYDWIKSDEPAPLQRARVATAR